MTLQEELDLDTGITIDINELADHDIKQALVVACNGMFSTTTERTVYELRVAIQEKVLISPLISEKEGDSPIESYNHISSKQRRNKRQNF